MYNPFITFDDLNQKVYRVAVQVGMRTLKRDFPFTDEGKVEADEHWKNLSQRIKEFHESSGSN